MLIEVRAVKGRKAYTKPKGGVEITDTWRPIRQTPWLKRLADNGDIESRVQAKAKAAEKAPEKVAATNNETKG